MRSISIFINIGKLLLASILSSGQLFHTGVPLAYGRP